mgnify:FL=1
MLLGKPKLAHFSLEEIKLYTTLKDRTEKDSVDPLSSITSALVKTSRNDISTFRIAFSPLSDNVWRTPEKVSILESGAIPDFLKKYIFYSFFWKVCLYPFLFLAKFIRFLVNPQHEEVGDKKHAHSDARDATSKTDAF